MPAVSAACPSAGELDGGLSGGQQITATAKYTILRCSGPVKSTNGGFRPALTQLRKELCYMQLKREKFRQEKHD